MFRVLEDGAVHDNVPVGEVTIVPLSPTATNCVSDEATPFRLLVVGDEVSNVHDVTAPVGEVRIVPLFPTATNCGCCDSVPLDQAMPLRSFDVPEFSSFHADPVGEERMVPLCPTAVNCDPDQTAAFTPFIVARVDEVHVTLSGEVRMVPSRPTTTD